MDYIYAIIKNESTKTLSTISEYIKPIPNIPVYKLCEFHNYSTSLAEQYSSCLPYINQNDLYLCNIQYRQEAIEFEETTHEVEKKYNTVAISHRKGGFTTIEWKFNEDISFFICTNFGYGLSSYFYSKYLYKNIMLTPYSFYVKYKHSDFASVVRCTYEYKVEYKSWINVMNDCTAFYNAIVFNKENHIFEWINNQLNTMVSELEKFIDISSGNFVNESRNNSHISGYTFISGDDFWIIKSKKIAYSLDFIDNIQKLPIQINPKSYVLRLLKLCQNFIPKLECRIQETNLVLKNQEENLNILKNEGDYPLYNLLYSKYYYKKEWYFSSNKFRMIWFLMHLKQKFHIDINLKSLKDRINKLDSQNKTIEKEKNRILTTSNLLSSLINDRDKINNYFKNNDIKNRLT